MRPGPPPVMCSPSNARSPGLSAPPMVLMREALHLGQLLVPSNLWAEGAAGRPRHHRSTGQARGLACRANMAGAAGWAAHFTSGKETARQGGAPKCQDSEVSGQYGGHRHGRRSIATMRDFSYPGMTCRCQFVTQAGPQLGTELAEDPPGEGAPVAALSGLLTRTSGGLSLFPA